MPTDRTVATPELFAWHGFQFRHPEDFAPVALTGTRAEGYVRLGSAGKLNIQVRWKSATKPGDLQPRLQTYLSRLERDAKKAKVSFRSDLEPGDDGIAYRYQGVGQGRGKLFFSEESRRAFFVEAVGGRKDSLLPVIRELLASFKCAESKSAETWAVLGLAVSVPGGMTIERKRFLAGRTDLTLKCRHARLDASRWGFGAQLVAKHGLEPWAQAALGLRLPAVSNDGTDVCFEKRGLWRHMRALVRYDEPRNQIVTVKVHYRNDKWGPTWDWLV